jgi:outer membrane cobalamin receptor
MNNKAFILLSTAFAASLACAQVSTVNEVRISADRGRAELSPQNARNPFRLAGSDDLHTQTLTRQDIEELRPANVFELLNNATGVLSTEGSRKGFSNLNIRGDSNFIWIVDGAYLQANMAGRLMKNIPIMAIEEVQVVRGGTALTMGPMTGSVSPGGAPVDGFVIVRTRKPQKNEGQARLSVESNDTVQAGLWVGRRVGEPEHKGYIAGLLNYSDTNGPSELLDNGAGYNVWRESSSGLAKTGFESHGWLLDLMAYKDKGQFGVPNANLHFGPTGNPPVRGTNGNWFVDPSQTDLWVINGSKTWSTSQTTLLSLSNTRSHQVLNTTSPATANLNDNETTHVNIRQHMDFDKTRIAIGGDFLHWHNPSGMNYFEGIEREEKTQGLFATVEQKLMSDRLTVDAGLRRDKVKVLHGLDYYTAGVQPPGGVNSPLIFQNRTLPAAEFFSTGASYQLNTDWKATARYAHAEQVSRNLNPMPGVVLGDDQQDKWELGLAGSVNAWFNPSVNLFSRKVANEKSVKGFTYTAVTPTPANTTCRSAVATTGANNLKWNGTSDITECYGQDDTLRQGVELISTGRFLDNGSYRLGWTHFTKLQRVELTTPKDIADLALSQAWGAYKVTASAKYVSSYRGSATDTAAYLGGYTRVDLGVGRDWHWNDMNWRVTTYVKNLTDKKYETSNGVQDIGRVLGLEVVTQF